MTSPLVVGTTSVSSVNNPLRQNLSLPNAALTAHQDTIEPFVWKLCFSDQQQVTENKDMLQNWSTKNASLAVLLTA